MKGKRFANINRLLIAKMLAIFLLAGVVTTGCEKRAIDYEQVGSDERIVIKFSHVVAESTPKGMAARRFAELVNRRTEGRVEVQVYPNSQLYMDGEEFDALQAGNVQMIAPATAKMTALYPQLLLFDMPFLFTSYEHVYETVDGPVGKDILAQITGNNMLGLAMWDNGFKQMAANRPLVTGDDFRGLTFRIMDSQLLSDQFRSVGALTKILPFNEVYSALEQKQVDGFENSLSNIYSKRFDRVISNITISNHGYLGYVVLTNEEFWLGLPEDIREILEETLAEVTLWQREIAMKENEMSLRELVRIQEEQQLEKILFLTEEQRTELMEWFVPVYRKYQSQIGSDLIHSVTAINGKSLAD